MFVEETKKPKKRGDYIMTQTVLNFKLEFNEKEEITPYGGLGLFGEMYRALGIDKEVDKMFSGPGSGKGFAANTYINPIVMMFIGGGRYIEDIRKIRVDKGLRKICKMEEVPSGDAVGDWVKRESKEKIESTYKVNDNLVRRMVRKTEEERLTLDIDAVGIEAEKEDAEYTYKGYKGYMPLLGFIPEIGCCVGYEFREGNVPPVEGNYEFTERIFEKVEGYGKKIRNFRSDAAGYQAKVVNYVNEKGARYTITVDKDESIKEAIKGIAEEEWKELKDRNGIKTDRKYVEFIHSMNKSDHAFRVVMMRWKNPQMDLFEEAEEYCYHGIATNFLEEEKDTEEVIWWHNGRSNSENYNKELKIGFNLEYMPCGEFEANAVWFGIGILAYNLFIASKLFLFPKSWKKKTIRTIRWQFIQIAGKVIKRARYLVLKICSTMREIYEIYEEARQRCWELQIDLGCG